jgi:hypothetical protein
MAAPLGRNPEIIEVDRDHQQVANSLSPYFTEQARVDYWYNPHTLD